MWGAVNIIMDKVFHLSVEQHSPAFKGLTVKWREQAGEALERFVARSDESNAVNFGDWGDAKKAKNLARWCSSRMCASPALRFLMMRVLSAPFSSSAAERNYSVWNSVWTSDNRNMVFENAAARVYMYSNQRQNDRISAEAFDADHFMHVAE